MGGPNREEICNMAAKRIVIDPVTRIEGHLRVELEVQNGKVVEA